MVLVVGVGRARRLTLGVRVTGSRAVGSSWVLLLGTIIPLLVFPTDAHAACGTGPDLILHFHLDHLSSTEVITTAAGDVFSQIRYDAYGRVRGRYTAAGALVGPNKFMPTEYAGYTTEVATGLQHAGVRTYDPLTGQFLQHDPKGQFLSPYAFGPGDPINGRDPTGTFWLGLIVFALIVANAIYAGVKTGSARVGWETFVVGVGMALTFYGLGSAAQAATAAGYAWAGYSLEGALAGYGAYTLAEQGRAAANGNAMSAVNLGVGIALLAVGAVRAYQLRSQVVSGTAAADPSQGEQQRNQPPSIWDEGKSPETPDDPRTEEDESPPGRVKPGVRMKVKARVNRIDVVGVIKKAAPRSVKDAIERAENYVIPGTESVKDGKLTLEGGANLDGDYSVGLKFEYRF